MPGMEVNGRQQHCLPNHFLVDKIFDLIYKCALQWNTISHDGTERHFLFSYSMLGSIPDEVIDSSDRVGTYLFQLAWR